MYCNLILMQGYSGYPLSKQLDIVVLFNDKINLNCENYTRSRNFNNCLFNSVIVFGLKYYSLY